MKCYHEPAPVQWELERLVAEALKHLQNLGYQTGTIGNYRYACEEFLHFARVHRGADAFSTDLVRQYLEHCGLSAEGEGTNEELSFRQRHIRTVMRALTEFALHGCIQRRLHVAEKVVLCVQWQAVLLGYEQFCRRYVRNSPSTLCARKREVIRFFHYLDSRGVAAVEEIQPATLVGFVTSLAHLKPASLARVTAALRSLLRHLCLQGLVSGDLANHLSRIRVGREQHIPFVWRQEDVDALLNQVNRTSPCGKRDYAILLLAARLGMRAGDIRTLRLDSLLWDQARIDIRQTKGGEPLSLPLTKEIGDALIDYLRHGRPPTHHREVFLRVNAPIEPFGHNNNLHNIITKYRRRAGITLPARSRRGLHSLRHTLASRLLEDGTSLETISAIMGHMSVETTRIYTKVDAKALRSVAFDPVEVVDE